MFLPSIEKPVLRLHRDSLDKIVLSRSAESHSGCPNRSDVTAKYICVSGDESFTALQSLRVPPILAS
jgi:hypothetical protein